MIYEYEGQLLRFINKIFPEIKEITYAKDESLILSYTQILKYPAVFYTRVTKEWTFPATWKLLSDDGRTARFVPVKQNYIARMFVATQADVLKSIAKLRLFWSKHSYIDVPWFEDNIRVALRLLYIKPDEERNPADKKGPKRFLEFSWESQLFIDETEILREGLVKEVRLFLTEDGQVDVTKDDNLIKVIK